MAKRILIESMTRHLVANFVIRCWREEEPDFNIENTIKEVQGILLRLRLSQHDSISIEEIAKHILESVDRMNAVEILLNGNGIVVYSDWP